MNDLTTSYGGHCKYSYAYQIVSCSSGRAANYRVEADSVEEAIEKIKGLHSMRTAYRDGPRQLRSSHSQVFIGEGTPLQGR